MKEVQKPKKPLIYYYGIVLLVLVLFNLLALPWFAQRQVRQVDYGTFLEMAENQELGQVEVQQQDNQILFTNKDNTIVYKTGMMPDLDLTQRLADSGAVFSGEIIQQTNPILSFLLSWVLPIVFFIAIGQFMSRKMMERAGGPNALSFGKSNAKVYVKSSQGIKFSDVAGEDEAKESLSEIVNYLHDPGKYREIGAAMPKGILLVGPPGTGKTMLAKAVAGEAGVPFFSMSGSEFVEMFVGMGASKVRDLFKQAKEKAPCVVFIDEIDAIGQKRDGRLSSNDEREQTLNQLLTEMDGFEDNTGVIILAAANRPESLDPALTRPGRFDRRVLVELIFHSVSTGASNDIEQATKLARSMVTRYGMSPDFDMVALETVTNQYLGGDASLACSAQTQTEIDRQVVALVKQQHEKASAILRENRDKLDEIAGYLYEKETITGDEFMEILNR